MQLSEHFSLAEMTRSETAARQGLSNDCPASLISRLTATAQDMERVRSILDGKPITIFSGYRSPEVNRAVGGVSDSAHCLCYAADFMSQGFTIARAIDIIRQSPLKFDQLIDEFGAWVHISFDPRNRRQVMSARKIAGKTRYQFI